MNIYKPQINGYDGNCGSESPLWVNIVPLGPCGPRRVQPLLKYPK